ncbi:septum formation family protein [Euzebya sp.]|uniref:septum formation family protein n=1 Tax=Euzebya sp. TaxID=1971409 RepID=UPI003511F4DF
MRSTRRLLPGLLLALAVLVGACSPSALAFTIGDCVNLPDGSQIDDYESVDCEEAHDAEVFALPQHPGGEEEAYPGESALNELARERCEAEFEPYVGTAYADSAIYYTALTPGEESWTEADDREIVCLLVGEPQDDGTFAQLTGSKEGSGE